MTDINKLLNTTSAGLLAQKLDAKDGNKDGKISASIWNEFVKETGGNEVKEFISVGDALNSLTTYILRKMRSNGKSESEVVATFNENADKLEASAPTNPAQPAQSTHPTDSAASPTDSDNTSTKEKAAKKLGLKETHATQTKGIYYNEQTKMYYKWNEKTHAFDALDKDTRYVSPDGVEHEKTPKKITTITDKKTGKLKSITEDWGNVAFTYDTNGNRTKTVFKDANGKVTRSWEDTLDANGKWTKRVFKDANGNVKGTDEYTYDANGNRTKRVSKDANGKVTESDEYTYDANGNRTKTVFKDANGKVTRSEEYTYDANGNCTKTVFKDANGKVISSYEDTYDANGKYTKRVYKDANGKEISEEEWYKL